MAKKDGKKNKNRKDDIGKGLTGLDNLMERYNSRGGDPTRNAMMDAYRFDTMSMNRNFDLSKRAARFQAGLSKDLMRFQFGLDQQGKKEDRLDIFGYNMRSMDKQYELQNLYANQQYGRDLGMLGATGIENRKNMRQQGVENRLQTITEGEQNRLGIAATGDQTRKNYRVAGEEERLNIAARGDEERKTYDHNDMINARTEERSRARSRALARSF